MLSSRLVYKAEFQGKYSATFFASTVFWEANTGSHFEGLGSIHGGLFNFSTLFRFCAPCSRLAYNDQSLDRAIFGFAEIEHYRESALDMIPQARHEELLDWVVKGILAEVKRKGNGDGQIRLGCIPYWEFVAKFFPECAVA